MGITIGCYDRDRDHKETNLAMEEKYSKLNEKYESERQQKSNLIDKIQESSKQYENLMNSQISLNEEYEKEIVKWKSKTSQLEESLHEYETEHDIETEYHTTAHTNTSTNLCNTFSDEYKQLQNNNENIPQQYQQQIYELQQRISQSSEQNSELKQEINKLNDEIKNTIKTKTTKISVSDIPVINDKMIIGKLKLQIAELEKKLNMYEQIKTESKNETLHSLNTITPGTEFGNIVLARYHTELSDISSQENVEKESGDEGSNSSSLEQDEKIEIAKIRGHIRKETKIQDNYDAMQKEMDALVIADHNSCDGGGGGGAILHTDSATLKNLLTSKSAERWPAQTVVNLKKEMAQQMIHLVKNHPIHDNVSQNDTDLP